MADQALIDKLNKAALLKRMNAARTQSTAPVAEEMAELDTDFGTISVPKKLVDQRNEEVKGGARALAKGATFGAAPRIEAAARTGFGISGDYGKTLDQIREENDEWAAKNPGTALTLELAGGVAVPGAVANATRSGARARHMLRRAGASAPTARYGGMAASAAPAGAAYGLMSGDDLTNVGEDIGNTLGGAVVASAAGPALMGLWAGAKAAGRGVRGAVQAATNTGARDFAVRKAADKFENVGIAAPATPRASWETTTRRGAADFDAAATDADLPGMHVAPSYIDPVFEAEAMKVAQSGRVLAQPYRDMANRVTHRQTERVAESVPELLLGRPTNYRQLGENVEHGATRAQDAIYDQLRQRRLGGRAGNVQLPDLQTMARENPDSFRRFYQQSLDDAVANSVINRAEADGHWLPRVNNAADHVPRATAHPYVLERMYHYLSQAHNGGDNVARGLQEQLVDALQSTSRRSSALTDIKAAHSEEFRNRDAFNFGSGIWATSGPARSRALTEIQSMQPRQHAIATEAAAGAVGANVAGDAGTFARPRAITARADNRRAIEEMYGQQAGDAVEDYIRREANAHDVSGRVASALTREKDTPDAIANLLKAGVQYQFTPSVAGMNLLARTRSGYTNKRLAETARLLTSHNPMDRARIRAELARRDRVLSRQDALADMLTSAAVASTGAAF